MRIMAMLFKGIDLLMFSFVYENVRSVVADGVFN